MSKKIIAFGASSSINSINKKFASYAVNQLADTAFQILDLNDFEMPIYSIDREKENGIPALAQEFKRLINEVDGIVISFAEHNGSYATAFKNIFDWISRLEGSTWADKPMLLLATSPGGRGGKLVLATAVKSFPHSGASSIVSFSLPSFFKNYSEESGILDPDLSKSFAGKLEEFQEIFQLV